MSLNKKDELSLEFAKIAAQIAIEQKSLDVTALDMADRSDIADYYVIGSGTSARHVKGIVDKIKEAIDEKPLSISGYDHGEWVLMDYENLLVHLFYEPTRQYYEVDELWKDAPRIELDEKLKEQALKLRTGMY